MKNIVVSGAAIIRNNNGKKGIFATQRGYGEFEGGWEIPGGKIESGETAQQCIIREIHEELDSKIEVEKSLGVVEYDYPAFHLTMHCLLCHLVSGKLTLLEHKNAKWLSRENLYSVEWLPADKLILPQIEKILTE